MCSDTLLEYFGVYLDKVMEKLTFVTYYGPNMPRVVGASASSRTVPFSDKWHMCIAQRLNTAMKHVMEKEPERDSSISNDCTALKKMTRTFKQYNWNTLLPEGHALVQAVDTMFGSAHPTVTRFSNQHKTFEILFLKGTQRHAWQNLRV